MDELNAINRLRSLDAVKSKRAFRRDRITKVKARLERLQVTLFSEIQPNEITNLRGDLSHEIKLHNALQARYKLLLEEKSATETEWEEELQASEEVQDQHKQYQRQVEALTERYSFYLEAVTIKAEYEEAVATEPSTRIFEKLCEKLNSRIQTFLHKTIPYREDKELGSPRQEIQVYTPELNRMLSEVQLKKSETPHRRSPPPRQDRKGFDVDLPSFSGKPTEWQPFFELFDSTLKTRGSYLNNQEKRCLLIKAMKSEEAKAVVLLHSQGEEGYEKAIRALINNYGSPAIVYPHHVRCLTQRDQYTYDRDSLRRLRQRFLISYEALKALEGGTLSQFLVALAFEDFDAKLQEEWNKHSATLESLPTLEQMFDFFEPLEYKMAIPGTPTVKEKPINSVSSASRRTPPAKTGTRHSNSPQCQLCNENHQAFRCPVFLAYDVAKKNKYVREQKWCINCLSSNHMQRGCPSNKRCRHCGGFHNTLLHREDLQGSTQAAAMVNTTSEPSAVRESQNQPDPPTIAFLSTAIVTAVNGARSRQARIALDTGAASSLITEALASHLKLKRYPQRLILEGAYGMGISKYYVQATLKSITDASQSITLKLSVVSTLPKAHPPLRKEEIATDPHIKDLQLADPDFGGALDVLVGSLDCCKCVCGSFRYHPAPDIAVSPTIFGWTVTGPLDYTPTSQLLKIQLKEDPLEQALARLWELDKTPETPTLNSVDEATIYHFQDTHKILDDGRYKVQLPRKSDAPVLGNSRPMAMKRFLQNERTLEKKGRLGEFNQALKEYIQLDHAEIVPCQDLDNSSYYLPVHGVFKEASTTTKVRPVFDASAKTSHGVSLNDTLETGPNLYPLLTDILIRFRTHRIGFSADISKMFREVLLHEDDRDLHRFLMRDANGQIQDHRMKRLTFGVKTSPFLATQVIRHLAELHTVSHPKASQAILHDFYVDDYLSGADSVQEACDLREQLCHLLQLAGMNLRKWRTSSDEFRQAIPAAIVETEDLHLQASHDAPKALGMHWDVAQDVLHVSTPRTDNTTTVTKRKIASDSARVFDVLGLFAPSTIQPKMLLQRLWKLPVTWDTPVPEDILQSWQDWTRELPEITTHPISQRYSTSGSPVLFCSLHGFSDASKIAYGAAVYLRQVHQDTSITVTLVFAKARVAPLKVITIPRAELVAAHLLAKLLRYVATLLNIDKSNIFAWTDSAIVLCWLHKSSSTLKTFVAHRIAVIQELLPASHWRHVCTLDNPADLLSRGTPASNLVRLDIWWHGPKWLALPPPQWPAQKFTPPSTVPETKVIINLNTNPPTDGTDQDKLCKRFSSYEHLTRVLAWARRFIYNSKNPHKRRLSDCLTSQETRSTKVFLLRQSQQETYHEVFKTCLQGRNPPKSHPLSKLNIIIDSDGLLNISSRVRDPRLKKCPKLLIPLSLESQLTRLMVITAHKTYQHPGVATLLSILGDQYHIPGLRNFLKKISRQCTTCQRAYARPIHQQMGLLPEARTTPAPPFFITGVDFAGPFTIRQGHTRRPVYLKTYACLFVCLTTRAVHLELCSDLSTEEFMAALRRFCARRGTPHHIHSDNGSNFVGAHNELLEIRNLTATSQQALSHFCSQSAIEWHFIPPRTPHFGGLWEAGVRSMKTLLRKLLTPHPMRFQELATILTEVEAILNSRPLAPLHATDAEDQLVLTPGHFLIGRPLKAPPTQVASQAKLTYLRRWALVQRLSQDLWIAWKTRYVQSLHSRTKWRLQSQDYSVGDIVYLKDESLTHRSWPLAIITQTYPGDDGKVRAVDIRCCGKIYKRSTHHLILALKVEVHLLPPKHVQDSRGLV